MACHPTFAIGHKYIIVAIDYFMKWVKAIPTLSNNGNMDSLFILNHIITRFGVLIHIVIDHGSHFQNTMMTELSTALGFKQEHSSSYYLQANEQIEVVNKSLKVVIQ